MRKNSKCNKRVTSIIDTTRMKDKTVPIDTSKTRLYTYGNDMAKRWTITYYIYSEAQSKLVRKIVAIPKMDSLQERLKFAKKEVREINQMLKEGYYLPAAVPSFNLTRAFNKIYGLNEIRFAPLSRPSYRSNVRDLLAFMKTKKRDKIKLEHFNKRDVIAFRDYLLIERKLTAVTINGYLGHLSTLFQDMVVREWVDENPFSFVASLKEKETEANRAITKNERAVLVPMLQLNRELWLFVQFIYYMWLRPNEVTQLKVKDFDLENMKISVSASVAKNDKSRWISIPPPFIPVIRNLKLEKYPSSYFIFCKASTKGGDDRLFGLEQESRKRYTKIHKRICRKLEIEGVTLYCWKGNGTLDAAKAGVSPFAIKEHGRWSSVDFVLKYLKRKGLNLLEETEIKKMPSIL